MQPYQTLANAFQSTLDLAQPPVAMAFCDSPPEDVSAFEGSVPAGCSFWERGASSLFVTSTADHALCGIGVHTHNLDAPSEDHGGELKSALEAMMGLDYVREDEIAKIPVLNRQAKHIVYGPLAQLPIKPDVVLLFAHAQQGLIISEAVQRVDGNTPPAMGRPACAVVPQVMNQGQAAMSLGCCGARAYMDILSDAVAMWALPGAKIERYLEEITSLAKANRTLSVFHQRRKADVANGEKPSVATSLSRAFS